MNFETICVQCIKDKNNSTGAVCTPIYQTSTFAHKGVGQSTGYDYSRLQNPTRENLEMLVAKLENGMGGFAFSTGMAAISTVMELFAIGDHIIATEDLYGGSIRLFNTILKKNGIEIDYAKTLNEIENKINDNTKAIFLETPTNPMMNVIDIAKVKNLIKNKNILLIVDNTFLTPYFQRPINLGADIVIHSGTKYLGGHNDTLAGFLVVNSQILIDKIAFIYKTIGACLSPFDSFLIIRGIKTLAIRMEKSQENAIIIANWLLNHKSVKQVYFIGLETHDGYEITKQQSSGFGSMVSFEVDSEETAHKILEKVNIITFAESLGGVDTLITYPMTQTHADVPIDEREARGINNRLLRMSVGIENVKDIISDLEQSLI